MSFSAEEREYLNTQRLARLATVSADGQPDVAPVGFEFDGSDFYIAGVDLPSTRKYLNVTDGNLKVALVVDDVVNTAPFIPRFVRVYGTASIVQREGKSGLREYLRISPTVSWSWNLEGRPLNGGQFRPRRVVHGSPTERESPLALRRPTLGTANPDARAAVEDFAAGLQAGHDLRDADILNHQFAQDVEWGSPYGALVDGYDRLHPIHVEFQRSASDKPAFRYEVRHVLPLSDDVVVAHVARLALGPDREALPPGNDPDQPFSEMVMFVLARRDGQWWLAAGQNTPIRQRPELDLPKV
jgi:pyridoxamine 5'-phosphate oxidase family protein